VRSATINDLRRAKRRLLEATPDEFFAEFYWLQADDIVRLSKLDEPSHDPLSPTYVPEWAEPEYWE
jgi:hypothetical protein